MIDNSFKTPSEFCEKLNITRPTADKLKHEPISMLSGKISYLLRIMEASGKSAKEVLSILNQGIKEAEDERTN